MNDYERINDYWFIGNKFRKFWFKKDIFVDKYIENNFGDLICKAENNKLYEWKKKPESYIALIIILDQFSRNIYRDNVNKVKINDQKCLELCKGLINNKFDFHLSFSQKAFLLLPFRHSKDLYNIYYSLRRMMFYKKNEKMDEEKTKIFNKFINSCIKDLKKKLRDKNFVNYN